VKIKSSPISYVKQQTSVIFEYYCDDLSKLKKINQIQTQTLKTIAAFKGALEYSQKIANYATAFQKINGTVKVQMGQIQNQISSAMNSENGSILELNVDLIILLAENDYPPIDRDEVYKEIFEQAENFKKFRG
jgi:hypothetical protein